MKNLIEKLKELRTYIILYITQTFSGLGSAMTSYALVIWSYEQQGSALVTSLLMVCSYAPYVILSIFAGALSDRWNKKKVMLVCDSIAAMGTVAILILLRTDHLKIWHLYLLNALNGLMNTVQQPASEVAVTRILPNKYYQKVGALGYFSRSLNSILTPIIATAILAMTGINFIIGFDLLTFIVAFCSLLFFIKIPEDNSDIDKKETLLQASKKGVEYLKNNKGIRDLIFFLDAINLTASMYQATFPAMMLSRNGGSEIALGMVNATIGITTLVGSIFASLLKAPKSRVKVICNTLLFSMSFENFILALGRSTPIWCLGGFLGWILIPVMSTNLEAIMRLKVPADLQGRVFSARNTLQFFTIPVGYFAGGILVDKVFEPLMSRVDSDNILIALFGSGKGSGAAFLFFILAFSGIATCLYFRRDHNIWELEKEK